MSHTGSPPIFEGNNLVCSGVQIEAYSVEDNGEGICFNVYCYNVQPGINIDYATGNSSGPASENTSQAKAPAQTESTTQPPAQPGNTETVWVSATGKKYHRKSSCSNMKNPSQISKSDAINRGYEPCKKCYWHSVEGYSYECPLAYCRKFSTTGFKLSL